MAEVLLLHHAQGLTSGVTALAERLRAGGHRVHVPDLFEGRTFDSVEAGVAHAGEIGFAAVADRGVRAADDLPAGLVYLGLSLGVMAAQQLAQTRPGAKGALLLHACLPTAEFGGWPDDVPVQVHAMADDPYFVQDGDLDAARALADAVPAAQLFLYPGEGHLFTDSSLAVHDEAATELLLTRVLTFLAAVG